MIDYDAKTPLENYHLSVNEAKALREGAQKALSCAMTMDEFAHTFTWPGAEIRNPKEVKYILRRIYREEESWHREELLSIHELLAATGISAARMSNILNVPLRTMYSWTLGQSSQTTYLLYLINFRLKSDPRFAAQIEQWIEDNKPLETQETTEETTEGEVE